VTAVEPRFDAVVHAPPRLQICGLLAAVDLTEFAAVRNAVGRDAFTAHVAELRRITGG
jgi:predicted methyltransferase